MKMLNIPVKLVLDLTDEQNYGFEKLKLTMSDKGTFILKGEEDGEKGLNILIMYDAMCGWLLDLKMPIKKETVDKFIEVCDLYYALGENILKLDEYGIMESD